jgi:hypothetical protein
VVPLSFATAISSRNLQRATTKTSSMQKHEMGEKIRKTMMTTG